MYIKKIMLILTADFKLIILLCFQQWVGETVPRKLFSELRQHIMGYKTY